MQPSDYEELLGRDFRFALRALADDIPAAPRLVDELLSQALDELLQATGRGRHRRYRASLLERTVALKGLSSGARLTQLLAERLNAAGLPASSSPQALIDVALCCVPHPVISERLLELLSSTDDPRLATSLANALRVQGPLPKQAAIRLLELCRTTDNPRDAARLANVLRNEGPLPPQATTHLLELLTTTDNQRDATSLANVLRTQGPLLPEQATTRLVELLTTAPSRRDAARLANALRAQGPLPEQATTRLLDALTTIHTPRWATTIADVLRAQGRLPEHATMRLLERCLRGSARALRGAAAARSGRLIRRRRAAGFVCAVSSGCAGKRQARLRRRAA